jgi:hypothetical protein
MDVKNLRMSFLSNSEQITRISLSEPKASRLVSHPTKKRRLPIKMDRLSF